ncbi:MAG: FHA domain-containing protein [Deltaproteobacteria bacterium]|nr:FHA domain-containing protein [Deltaproteobacteria bacterium]
MSVSAKTIGVDLWGGQARGAAANARTILRPVSDASLPRKSMRELFFGAYDAFVTKCRAVDEPGVAIVAVHEKTGKAQGLCVLRARVDRFVAAIVGRHDRCDLFINASEALSLRHLAIVLDPVKSWKRGDAAVRYRVLDLRTRDGFADETGRPLRGLRAEGPALLKCAGYAFFMLPVGDPTDWPASPQDAWAMLPERVYFDETEWSGRCATGSMPKMPKPGARTSTLVRTHGPHDTGVGLVRSGSAAGTLELRGSHTGGYLDVGNAELADGILLGRYPRCNGAGFSDDPSLSRVHALLIQVDDRLLLVDTSSRNGSRLRGCDDARVIEIVGETELELGTHTRVRWRWTS